MRRVLTRNITALFLLTSIGAFLPTLGFAATEVDPDDDENTLLSTKCITIGAETDYHPQKDQKRLRALFQETQSTSTGESINRALYAGSTSLCFAEHLNTRDRCGNYEVGESFDFLNTIFLNPFSNNTLLTIALIHEARHKQQVDVGLSKKGINVRESTRIQRNWFREADARAASIVYAYEKKLIGDETYMNMLAKAPYMKEMVDTFLSSITENPDDVSEAIRKSIKAFRNDKDLAFLYDRQVVENVRELNQNFDPNAPEDSSFLNEEALYTIGQIGRFRYMTPDLIAFIRDSFTQDDYRRLEGMVQTERLVCTP